MLDALSRSKAVPGAFAAALVRRHRLHPVEALPVLILAAVPFFPDYLPLATQAVIYIVFALGLDLLVGAAGIVTLGQSAFFGIGAYTAGILSTHGWGEPLTGLLAGGLIAGAVGAVLGAIVLRTARFTLLMLTLCSVFLAGEVANKAGWLTGGADGLSGMATWPILGQFGFDFFGYTAFFYACAVLALVWFAMRWFRHAPIGQGIAAIRDNPERAAAIGMPVLRRLTLVFALSAVVSGVAGALQAEIAQFVGLNAIGFDLSAQILVMLALGGAGRLYGAFVGPAVFVAVQDQLAEQDPALWTLWLGLMVLAVVLFARGGIMGLADRLLRR
jgi:branched-chain amino acid transport system permease protein